MTRHDVSTTAVYHAAEADILLKVLREAVQTDLAAAVRWYREQMPEHYFQVTTTDEQVLHLQTIHALRRQGDGLLSVVEDPLHGKLLVLGRPDKHPLPEVIEVVSRHPSSAKPIDRVELTISRDRSLFLFAFGYGQTVLPAGFDLGAHRERIRTAACGQKSECSLAVNRFLDTVDQGYLARSRVERVVRHALAWAELKRPEDLHLVLDLDHGDTRFLLAAGTLAMWPLLEHVAQVLTRHPVQLSRGYLDFVPAVAGAQKSLVMTLYVRSTTGGRLAHKLEASLAKRIASDLMQVRDHYANDHLRDLYGAGKLELTELAVLRALACLAGYLIGPDHPYLDAGEVAEEAITTRPELARGIAELLESRFRPGSTLRAGAWQRRLHEVRQQVHAVEIPAQALVLESMVAAVAAVQLTNAWRTDRLGLAFKLDPLLLPANRFPHRPYGLLFFFGPQARGFHVRFRASARGGLRVLLPRNSAHYARARDGVLNEVYDLAWAQQLKNKDIPEGGSKCIALVEPGADADAAVHQVVDALLDLVLPAAQVPEVIGPHGEARGDDLIFLGPDENMTPERIVWVASRARERGLPHHATLMSSKPGAGINHKQFGVTSEGLFSWIRQVLPLVGIAEGQPYTLKITGGPDGDLGGNLIKILHHEHEKRCRITAIGDGTGAVWDPAGLDWRELLRLVREGRGIAAFDPAKLSTEGRRQGAKVVPATDREGEQFRNGLHNRVKTDLFVPCGGRPNTINDGNWQEFLHDGVPSAKAMVEGANIFITANARHALEDAGLLVVKDSSANKGGVICSSYEVLAGLILDDAEFLALKPTFVSEVLDIIRARAEAEARALIAAWKRRGGKSRLSDLSQQLSEEINRVSGEFEPLIDEHLDDATLQGHWIRHLEAHCPPSLLTHRDRLAVRVPRRHRVAILAKRIASRVVYQEGLTWSRTYVAGEEGASTWELLRTYLAAEAEVGALTDRLKSLHAPEELVNDHLLAVIRQGAQRELVRLRLGNEF